MFYAHAQKQTNKHNSLASLSLSCCLTTFAPSASLWTISISSFYPERTTVATALSPPFSLYLSRKTTYLLTLHFFAQHYDTSSAERVSVLRRTNSLATSSWVL